MNRNEGFLNVSFVVLSGVIGACVLLLMYIIRVLKIQDNNDNPTNDSNKRTNTNTNTSNTNVSKLLTASQQHHHDQQQNSAAKGPGGAGNKKQKTGGNQDPKWAQGRSSDKHNYTHPWLLTSLKGHTGQVFDMDFSSNGKYLASCAEEPDPGGHTHSHSHSHSHTRPIIILEETIHNTNDCNKENNQPIVSSNNTNSNAIANTNTNANANASTNATTNANNNSSNTDKKQGLSRRQRKNRRREDSSPPAAETKKKSRTKRKDSQTISTPLKQFAKLGLNELQLSAFLRSYLLNADQMLQLGYPVESELHPGRAIIFKSPMTAQQHYNPYKASRFDVNAREFIPQTIMDQQQLQLQHQHQQQQQYVDYSQIKQAWSSSHSSTGSSDSSSEPASLEDSDDNCGTSSDQDSTVKSSGSAVRDIHNTNLITSEERQCVRCGHGFFVASDGEYLTQEHCVYHWGKLQRVFTGPAIYSCCKNVQGSSGCSVGKLHVWNGVGVGFNGPFDSYARTRARKTPPPDGNYGVYALDCEMCYTVGGLELAKVTVIGADGRLVYDCFVKPEHEIVDYNTRFSGITARDLSKRAVTKTLREVQNDLMGFVNADTILIGHGLENDLRALRIMHGTVVDTAVTFPHYNGLPYRRSLKSLTQCYLKREIQCGNAGHNSCEDARACMELMLWRIRKDFKLIVEHLHHEHNQQQQQQQQHHQK